MLADLDAKSYNIFKILSKISDKINLKACQTWQTQLNEFTRWKNEFIKIKDSENNNIIIFNDNGILTLPKCEIVKTIEFRVDDECRKDVAVRFEIKKIKINGYLSNYNILRTDSNVENCDVNKKIYIENMILEKKGRKISIINSTYKKLTFNKINFQPNQILLDHDLELETKFDFVKEIHWLLNDHGIELIDNEIQENKQDESEIIKIITQIYQFIKKMKIWIILLIITTIIIKIMIVMIRLSWFQKFWLFTKSNKFFNLLKCNKNNDNPIEMVKKRKSEMELIISDETEKTIEKQRNTSINNSDKIKIDQPDEKELEKVEINQQGRNLEQSDLFEYKQISLDEIKLDDFVNKLKKK